MIGGRTRLYLLLGRPVGHSLSPAMQNAAFRTLGLDAVYAALDCGAEDVPVVARALAAAGGGGNATVPHKQILARAVVRPSERLARLESANVFWGEDGKLAGESTDIDGVLEALHAIGAPATTWLVVGTGGSARAVAGAAAERGARLAVRSRDGGRAKEFERWGRTLGVKSAEAAECEVLINATPLGLTAGDALPLVFGDHPRARWALDLVYHRGATPWVRAARDLGITAADGRGMLVAQGAASLEQWFPGARAPREAMRAAVERALA